MKNKKKRHRGSNLLDFLHEEGVLAEVKTRAQKRATDLSFGPHRKINARRRDFAALATSRKTHHSAFKELA